MHLLRHQLQRFIRKRDRHNHKVLAFPRVVPQSSFFIFFFFFFFFFHFTVVYAPLHSRDRYVRRALTPADLSWKTMEVYCGVARIEIGETAGRRAAGRLPIQIHQLSSRKWQENHRYRYRCPCIQRWGRWSRENWGNVWRNWFLDDG